MLHQLNLRATSLLVTIAMAIGVGVAGDRNRENSPPHANEFAPGRHHNNVGRQPPERGMQQEPARPSTQPRDDAKSRTTWTNPECIAGHRQCVDCHKQEVKAWLASKHSARAFDLLRTTENALEYAKNLEIRPIDIARSSLCVNCHGTPMVDVNGRPKVFGGVSCEACHGASLGATGWLNGHAVYGPTHTLRNQETPTHYLARQSKCEDAGQLRSSNLYGLTKRCFDCHVVGDESLSIAGHTHGKGFEMIAKAMGEVRHNFALDANVNAKISTLWSSPVRSEHSRNVDGRLRVMFILGQMVDLEVSLRNLSRASAENDYSDALIGRIEDALELLGEDLLEEVQAIDEEDAEDQEADIKERPELKDIQAIVDIVTPIWEELDDDGFKNENVDAFKKAADSIAIIAQDFSKRDGNDLAVIDQLELFPEDYLDGAYSPNAKTDSDRD